MEGDDMGTPNWKLIIKLVQESAKEQSISQMTIADLTGLKQPAVSRFFKGEKCPHLDTFLKIIGVVYQDNFILNTFKEASKNKSQ